MSIQLLSVSHKAAPLQIRELFAFSKEQQLAIMEQLRMDGVIQEAVVLSTCNRTEVYVYSEEENERIVYDRMLTVVSNMAKENQKENESKEEDSFGGYYRLYHGEKAIHHLFSVTAGLDSLVIGEDQILGQVKRAHAFAREHKQCGVYLNTFFRYAVTGTKKVKTQTDLSKTSVSTATLAVKVLQEEYQSLVGKKIMVIGATGKIGSIVLKNLQSINGIKLYVTMRGISAVKKVDDSYTNRKNGCCYGDRCTGYEIIPYEERYHYIEEMDGIISATASPHYTITASHLKRYWKGKKMVFVDLAVPMDIEHEVGQLAGISCYHMDDLSRSARENNERKKEEAIHAKRILRDYEVQFKKWFLFQQSYGMIDEVTNYLEKMIEKKGTKKVLNQFFYQMREANEPEMFANFLQAVKRYQQVEIEEKEGKEE